MKRMSQKHLLKRPIEPLINPKQTGAWPMYIILSLPDQTSEPLSISKLKVDSPPKGFKDTTNLGSQNPWRDLQRP